MNTRISISVTLNKEADPESVAEKLFSFLASDDDDLFPEIETVDTYDWSRDD